MRIGGLGKLRGLAACAAAALTVAAAPCGASAKIVCRDGQCFIEPDDPAGEAAETSEARAPRAAFGYMRPARFTGFLAGADDAASDPLADRALLAVLLVAFLGGLALNLTPCVLPMIPVSLAVIGCGKGASRGEGFVRGCAYGAGIALAYGALGAAVAFGFTQFGALQSSPWFGIVAGGVFVVMGLAMMDLFAVDFSRLRARLRLPAPAPGARRGAGGAFLAGTVAALAAGACVAPAVVAVCAYAAAGGPLAWTAPFALGLGMAAPWPLLGAGLAALPKPGRWMSALKKALAAVLVAYGAWWAVASCRALAGAGAEPAEETVPPARVAEARAAGRRTLVMFGAPWCRSCGEMKRTTLRDGTVRAALEAFDVLRVEVDDPKELAPYEEVLGLKITGLPAYVVMGGEGEEE